MTNLIIVAVFRGKIEIKTNADKIIERQDAVRDRENPISDQKTVNRKTDRRKKLPDKK